MNKFYKFNKISSFWNLATSISASENKFSLWLTSLIYVIISRVRYSSTLHFVGGKTQIKNAIIKVLSTKHHEESIFKFMQQLKNNKKQSIATHFPCTAYIPSHFEVPATGNGFVLFLSEWLTRFLPLSKSKKRTAVSRTPRAITTRLKMNHC